MKMCFSKYFSSYIQENGISINKLSKITGIDRTALYRYQNGDRVPKNFAIVETIANGLNMNLEERYTLYEEFDKSTYGEDVVNSFLFTRRLMEKIRDETAFSSQSAHSNQAVFFGDWQENDKCVQLCTSQDITVYAIRMFMYSKQNNGYVKICVDPTVNLINDLIIPFFSNTDITIEQIICFERSMEKCYLNLEMIGNIIPISFSVKNYNVFYRYGNISINSFNNFLLSNIVVTESSALVFNNNLDSGFFTTDPVIVKTITDTINNLSKKLFSLIEQGDFMSKIEELYFSIDTNTLYTMFNQPCLGPCMDSKILNESIHDFPSKQNFIKALFNQYGDWKGTTHIFEGYRLLYFESLFTKDGLRQFAKTGIISEFPENLHHPLTIEARILVLKRMIILMDKQRCDYYMFKKDVVLPHNIHLYCEFKNRVIWFRSISMNRMLQINTSEQSLLNALANAKKYADLKEMFCTKEELKEFIGSLIEDLRNC